MTKKPLSNGVIIKNFPGYFLIACLIVALLFVYALFKHFLAALALAAILATVFYPVYQFFLKLFRQRDKFAALVSCLLIFLVILLPVIFFVLMLGRQAVDTYAFIERKIHSGALEVYLNWQKGNILYDLFDAREGQLGSLVDMQNFDFKESLTEAALFARSFLVSHSTALIKGLGGLFLGFVIMFFGMYYFFKDAQKIGRKLMKISPLPLRHEIELFDKFKEISGAALVSIFLKAIVQGIVGGLGFAFVGIPGPLFWGTIFAFASVVPFIGTSLVWLPASVLLLLGGQTTAGIFLIIWNLVLTSNIDNVLCALFIGNKARINPLLAFLSVFGGIGLFGLIGILFGPLILVIFFTLLHIYEFEYKKILGSS